MGAYIGNLPFCEILGGDSVFDNSNQKKKRVVFSFVIWCHPHLQKCSHQFFDFWGEITKREKYVSCSYTGDIGGNIVDRARKLFQINSFQTLPLSLLPEWILRYALLFCILRYFDTEMCELFHIKLFDTFNTSSEIHLH